VKGWGEGIKGRGNALRTLNPDLSSFSSRHFRFAVWVHDLCVAVCVQFADGVGVYFVGWVPAEEGAGGFCHAPSLLLRINTRGNFLGGNKRYL